VADHRAAFSAARWVAATAGGGDPVPGVWTKELLTSGHGDLFALLRLDRGSIAARRWSCPVPRATGFSRSTEKSPSVARGAT
jgi:hypothetical protein